MKIYFPDDTERLQWIFAQQVFGLAPTKIIYAIATNYIFGFENKDGIEVNKDHFKCFDALPSAQKGMLKTDLESIFEDSFKKRKMRIKEFHLFSHALPAFLICEI